MEQALEAQLKTLGDHLEGTLEKWRETDTADRDALNTTVKALEDEIGAVKEQLAEERRGYLPGVEAATPESGKEGFSMARACRALARKDFSDAPYEQEVFQNMKAKAMSAGVDPSGGYIVPEEAISTVIEALKANVIAYDLGARDMAATGVPLTIPKLTTSATGYWVSENSTINASDLGFEQINMTPKTVAGRVILSNLLLETSTPTADSIIQQDLASQLGLALDAGILNGSSGGGAGEPVGIMQTAGISSFTSAADADSPPTVAELRDAITDLDTANALTGRLGWAIHPTMWAQCQMIKNEQTDASWLGVNNFNVAAGGFDTLFGFPIRTSTQMTAPTTGTGNCAQSMLFGNWDDVMVARWGGLRLLASDTSDDAFSKDQTHIRATMRCDVALRHPESFSVSAD
tara:strand:+ start:4374 stop:5588 length:1215 start_codon:yes stop_codon:yes gene_type:complete